MQHLYTYKILYTQVCVCEYPRMINDMSFANPYVKQVPVLTSPCNFDYAIVLVLLGFGGFYHEIPNVEARVHPCNIMGNAGSCSCRGCIRD